MPNVIQGPNYGMPTDYTAEMQRISQQQLLAQLLQKQAMQPIQPQQVPGGVAVRTSPMEGFGKLAEALAARRMQDQGFNQMNELARRRQGAMTGDIQTLVQALQGRLASTGQPDPQEMQQSADQGTPAPQSFQIPGQTPMQGLQAALPNLQSPEMTQLAGQHLLSNMLRPPAWKVEERYNSGTGQKEKVMMDMNNPGNIVPFGGQQAQALHFQDTGPSIIPLDPNTGQPRGQPIQKGMTPGESANLQFKVFEFNNLSQADKVRFAQEAQKIGISAQQLAQGAVQLMEDGQGNVFAVNKMTRTGMPAVSGQTGEQLNLPKPVSEVQGTSALYGKRAAEAEQILSTVGNQISVPGLAAKQGLENVWGVGGMLGAAGNAMLSQNQQKVEQAQRNFVNAVLRRESGAVISPQEFVNAQKQYFPQPGDGPQVIAQKQQNRLTAIQGLHVMAGPAAARIGAPMPPQQGGQMATGRIGGNVIDFSQLPP